MLLVKDISFSLTTTKLFHFSVIGCSWEAFLLLFVFFWKRCWIYCWRGETVCLAIYLSFRRWFWHCCWRQLSIFFEANWYVHAIKLILLVEKRCTLCLAITFFTESRNFFWIFKIDRWRRLVWLIWNADLSSFYLFNSGATNIDKDKVFI